MQTNSRIVQIILRKPLLFITGLTILIILFVISYRGRLTGRVVDAETGKPVVGAVIFAEWMVAHGIGDQSHTVTKVSEKLSDEGGYFSIAGPINLFAEPPKVLIYKKGYEVWHNEFLFPSYRRRFKEGNKQIIVRDIVIRLEKFKPPYLNLKQQQPSGVNATSKYKYYLWDGKKPLNPRYSHIRHVDFIDDFTWRSGKRIEEVMAWEKPLADAEKNIVIETKIKCTVVDASTGKPIKGAVIDTAGCRKSRSKDKRCGILTDANGDGYITLSAPFLTNPPFIEVYKNGYWLWKFYDGPWEGWSKIEDGMMFQLNQCAGYTQTYCTPYEINP